MQHMPADLIRSSLVNCTQGEAKRFNIPSVDDVRWDDLDYLGWLDPRSPLVGGMALWRGDEPISIVLRATQRPPSIKSGMCSLCLTVHSSSDVSFMGAKRAGARGRDGNTVAMSMCADLACSLYARKLKQPRRVQPQESIDVDGSVARLQANLDRFVARVVDGV